ncbi:hypothetical protein QTP81_14360 [Alteromonas sp. ASW11-36]|uniref:DUF3251 domain-containing protein n=1 Tax=Alteromonas arenosi TaxID=3055817 RepID=A0ABT7T1U7_9ALTE|nr:DUF6776 family protein [Alteromonas sp. ASW11-36]MDM7861782.1 hypothetical protein [Alteromonas sp. ASW11-36]
MNLQQLRTQLSETRYTLVIVLVMLVMLYIGFQLAQLSFDYLSRQLAISQNTAANLAAENQRLVTTSNELSAQLEIAKLANEALDERIRDGLERERALKEQVTFYQNVVAPELSEQGFSADGVQITAAASEGYYTLSMVLIQQTRVKGTINGRLNLVISGSQNGQPASINLNRQDVGNDGQMDYSFRYFQTMDIVFTLPADFVPERLQISTDIRQFRRVRGSYSRTLDINITDNGEIELQ